MAPANTCISYLQELEDVSLGKCEATQHLKIKEHLTDSKDHHQTCRAKNSYLTPRNLSHLTESKFHCCVNSAPPLVPILSHTTPIHIPPLLHYHTTYAYVSCGVELRGRNNYALPRNTGISSRYGRPVEARHSLQKESLTRHERREIHPEGGNRTCTGCLKSRKFLPFVKSHVLSLG